jgi:CBS domain-containing protein
MSSISLDTFNETISLEDFETPVSSLDLHEPLLLDTATGPVTIKDAIETMRSVGVGHLVVTENKVLKGILTERDILHKLFGVVKNYQDCAIVDYMTANPFTITPESSLLECMKTMGVRGFRHLPLVNESHHPIGVLSIKDILTHLIKFFPETFNGIGGLETWEVNDLNLRDELLSLNNPTASSKVIGHDLFITLLKDVITTNALKADYQSSIFDIAKKLRENRQGSLGLMEYESKLRGMITERDFLKKIFLNEEAENGTLNISHFMTPNPDTLLERHLVGQGLNNMFKKNYRNLVIVDEDQIPVSIITLVDILRFIYESITKELENT